MAKGGQTLILDIDSSSVGACVIDEGELPIVSAVKRVPIGTGITREPAALIPQLKEALMALIPEYIKLFSKIQNVSVVVASPWFAATLRTLASKSDKPVKVTASSISRVVTDYRKTESAATDGRVTFEAVPVTVLVNGYRTAVHRTVHGKTLAVTLYQSVGDQALVQTVTDAVHGSFAKARITWHTTPLAYAETLLRLSDEDHATVVDVGGEVTDIMILSHQTVAYIGSIPIGARTIARSVAGNPDGLADALSRLSMFARGDLSDKEMQVTGPALTTAAAEWQKNFVTILDTAGNTVPVPHRVFVVGERDELQWFSQVVMGAELRGQRPIPTVVNADLFAGLVTYGEGGLFDASLILDALFFHIRGSSVHHQLETAPVLYSVQ